MPVTKKGENKDPVYHREDSVVEEEKDNEESFLENLRKTWAGGRNEGHANRIEKPDDDILKPVENHEVEDSPAEKDGSVEWDEVCYDQRNRRENRGPTGP